MSTRKTKLEAATERRDIALAELQTAVYKKRLGKVQNVARYDAVESSKQRRQPAVERKSEDNILNSRKRLLSHNVGRDLERNSAPARGIMHQFRINVVGPLGKLQVNVDGGDEAAQWFNGDWAKDCDFRDDVHWSTQCQNVVAAAVREGDILAVFDDDLIDDSGKLLMWEADQIVSLSEDVFKGWDGYQEGYTQENGIVRDGWGRVVGYFASGERGLSVVDELDKVTFFPRGQARLVKNPWRINQGRGIGSLLTSATNFQDLYEILVKELQSAKVAASMAGWTKRENAETDWDTPAANPEYLPENIGKTTTEVDAEAANGTDPTAKNYENFESLTGGIWEYLAENDQIEFANIDRPNVHLAEFIEAVLGHAGASVGLARAYTILRADSSYTSFRGDMVLSWATFYTMQKWLERAFADWVAQRALAWAIKKGKVEDLPDGWESSLSWVWPKMPNVDELKEAMAVRMALKNGTTDYSKLLGPDWRQRLGAFGEQFDAILDLGLPLSITESISGNELMSLEGEL